MAVAHDAISESHTGTAGVASVASFTWNHTPTGTPRSALVFTLAIGANPVTSVTYGGTNMSAVPYTAYDSDTEPGFVQAWFLDNVASGTQAVVVNRTNNAVVTYAVCMTQTAASACQVYSAGVKTIAAAGTEQTAASSSGTGTSSSWSSMTLDDGSPGTNSQRYMAVYSGAASVSTASTNTTSQSTGAAIDFGNYVFATYRETTPSQGAKALNITTAISDDLAVIGLAVRETPAANVTITPGAAALALTAFRPYVAGDPYMAEVIADAPVFVLPMGESSGNLTDRVASKTATVSGSPTYGATGPVPGYTAIDISAGTQYFTVADHADLDLNGTDFTVELWYARDTDVGNWQGIVSKQNAWGVSVHSTLDSMALTVPGVTTLFYTQGTVPADSTWHHYVFTQINGASVPADRAVYVDGSSVAATHYSYTAISGTATDLVIGQDTATYPAQGKIAFLAVYKSVLSAGRVADHYAAATAPTDITITPAARALTLTGIAPTVRTPRLVTPAARALTLTGLAPSVKLGKVISPGTRALSVTGIAPTVRTPRTVTPAARALTVTGLAPTVRTPRLVTPGARALTLTGIAPVVTVGVSDHKLVTPPTATLTLTRLVPAVRTPRVVTPAVRALSLSTLAPQARTPRVVTPGPLGLTTTLYAPVVTASGAPLVGGYPPTGYAYASAPRGAAGSPVPTGGAGMTGPSGTALHASPTGAGGRNV